MVILIICILFSITAVSANDNQTDILNQNLADNDMIKNTVNKSYNDFSDDIECCTDTFNIENNYVYNEKDDVAHLAFNQSNLVINGNATSIAKNASSLI